MEACVQWLSPSALCADIFGRSEEPGQDTGLTGPAHATPWESKPVSPSGSRPRLPCTLLSSPPLPPRQHPGLPLTLRTPSACPCGLAPRARTPSPLTIPHFPFLSPGNKVQRDWRTGLSVPLQHVSTSGQGLCLCGPLLSPEPLLSGRCDQRQEEYRGEGRAEVGGGGPPRACPAGVGGAVPSQVCG